MEKAHWLSLQQAKDFFGVDKFNIKKNAKNGKLSILLPCGNFVRIQQDLDKSLPIAFMTEALDEFGDPDWYEGCLVNTKESTLEDAFDI